MGLNPIFQLRGLELIGGFSENSQNPLGLAASPAPMAAYGTTRLVIPQLVSGHRAATAKYLGLPQMAPFNRLAGSCQFLY